jgi:antagonist of KipI
MTAERATLTLLTPGMYTLIVDAGRPRSRSLGVPVGGAADRFSLAIGNALVGNPPDAAALEITQAGPALQADAPLACVLFGAPFAMSSDRQELTAGKTFTLEPGERLKIGGTPRRMRAYFCVRGGIDAPVILSSRSSLVPLKAGDRLDCRSDRIKPRWIDFTPDEPPEDLRGWMIPRLLVLPGAQYDWFRDNSLDRPFEVTRASNRMGLRLKSEPLRVPPEEMVSEPVCPGTVQVTRDGQCIILGVDGQTIGGYPKVAQVIRADLDQLGQLRPGEICFAYVSLQRAEELYRQRMAVLREWLARLVATRSLRSGA